MKFKTFLLAGVFAAGISSMALAQEVPYTLHPGDSLDIKVLRYAELSTPPDAQRTPYIVRQDGKMTFPLLGEIDVAGKTVQEFTDYLNTRLKEYLTQPEVYVNVIGEGTTRVYLFGEIRRPGMYELKKSRRVIDAIAAAGTYTEKTAKKTVFLIRKDHKDGEEPIKINLKKMLDTGNLEQNYELHEGDILFFDDNGKFTFGDFMPYLSAVYMGASIKSDLNDNN